MVRTMADEREAELARSGSASGSDISALDLEKIIDDVIQTLLQDPSFISLVQVLSNVPAVIHNVSIGFTYMQMTCI